MMTINKIQKTSASGMITLAFLLFDIRLHQHEHRHGRRGTRQSRRPTENNPSDACENTCLGLAVSRAINAGKGKCRIIGGTGGLLGIKSAVLSGGVNGRLVDR